jgi:hypothetical protein
MHSFELEWLAGHRRVPQGIEGMQVSKFDRHRG